VSRKRRDRQQAARDKAPPREPVAAPLPPDDAELQLWPDYWRRFAELLYPAWLRHPDPAAPTVRFDPSQRRWSWGSPHNAFGATLLDGAIQWREEWPDDNEFEQSIAEFIAFGAPDDFAPPLVASDLREAIRARNPAGWPDVLAQAAVMRWDALKRHGLAGARGGDTGASQPDYTRTGTAVWEWGDSADGYTAILTGKSISWNWHGPKDFGNTIGQSVIEFIARGSDEKTTPDALAWEMFLAVRERDFKAWPGLLAKAGQLQDRDQQGTPDGQPEPRRDPKWSNRENAPRASSPSDSETAGRDAPEPLGAVLLQGAGVIGASAAIAMAVATVMPTLGKYVSILLPVLLGFAAAFRWGSMALIVAGFFGVAAGAGGQYAFERHMELARGVAVTLESIADAPNHPDATRFVVSDARAAPAFPGSTERTTVRQHGAGPRIERWSLQVMPLVPRSWNRAQAVPAWLACTTSVGSDCLDRADDSVSRTVRVRDYDLDFYRAAVAAAERRHGVRSAPDAPVVEISSDPVGAPGLYLAGAAIVPLAVYALWAIGLAGWRGGRKLWKRNNAAPS